jgi:hypothetical protein
MFDPEQALSQFGHAGQIDSSYVVEPATRHAGARLLLSLIPPKGGNYRSEERRRKLRDSEWTEATGEMA